MRPPQVIQEPELRSESVTPSLANKQAMRKNGAENFEGEPNCAASLLDFWQWAYSDLLSNTNRGRLAEFIVARALGLGLSGVRTEWDAVDLVTPTGIKVEVKSSAYLQSWFQKKLSDICFVVPARRGWDAKTNETEATPRRHADVYVFALLAHQDKESVDPLDLTQWRFYVLPTKGLDSRKRSQYSITLKSLRELCPIPTTVAGLRDAIEDAARLD